MDLLEMETTDFFLPIYQTLLDDTQKRLQHGLEYLKAIPQRYWRLRITAWWPLAIGLKTLNKLRFNNKILNSDAKPTKISRWEVYWLLLNSPWQTLFNPILHWQFEILSRS